MFLSIFIDILRYACIFDNIYFVFKLYVHSTFTLVYLNINSYVFVCNHNDYI